MGWGKQAHQNMTSFFVVLVLNIITKTAVPEQLPCFCLIPVNSCCLSSSSPCISPTYRLNEGKHSSPSLIYESPLLRLSKYTNGEPSEIQLSLKGYLPLSVAIGIMQLSCS